MKFCLLPSIVFCCCVALSASVSAQTTPPDDEDVQSWNDLQVTVPITKKIDFVIMGTVRFGKDVSRITEARAGAGVVWKVNKAFSVSPSYLYIEARNTAGIFRTEHRYSLRGAYKFPIKRFGLSHRSMYEYRVRGTGNSWRYRPSLTFEKVIPENIIPKAKLFITEEVFYVSTHKKFTRNRLSVGISKTLNQHLTLDLFYMRQNDGNSQPGDLNVIGTTWKIHL